MRIVSKRVWPIAAMTATALVLATPGYAQQSHRQTYDLAAQDLGAALRAVGLASGTEVLAPADLVGGKTAPALHGTFTPDEAVAALLQGSGLVAHPSNGGLLVGKAVVIPLESEGGDPFAKIVITGTNIRGAAPVGSPLITLGRLDLDRSGYATTQQMLQTLPQNFGAGQNEATFTIGSRNGEDTNQAGGSSVNLRGLGASSTLVLLNGNRVALGGLYGTFADLSLIPSSVIDRVEVLTDGSSALYGSDAVAGVVNVLMRDHFEGAETRLRTGLASDYREWQASQIIGHGWSTGHATLAYEYYRHGHLPAADWAFATEDLRRFGGPDFRTDFSNPGTIHSSDGTSWAIPRGQDGGGLVGSDFVAGTANLADGRAYADLLPFQQRHSGYVSLSQAIGDRLTVSLQGLIADRTSLLRLTPLDIGTFVPTSNAFYVDPSGSGQPVTVDYDFTPDLGPISAGSHVRGYNAVAGLDWTLGPWSVTGRGTFGQQTETTREFNIPNYYYLGLALADSNPATAYNVFGDGSHTNPATIASVAGYYDQTGLYRLWAGDLKADGPLFRLPGGSAKLAIGGEYRVESYDYASVDFESYATPTRDHHDDLPIDRRILAGYAELLLPLLGEDATLPFAQKLTVSAAGRIEHYNDFGTTTNPKVGIDWVPLDGLTLRASYGTSFRAPGFQEIRSGLGTGQYLPIPVADPRSPTGTTNALFLFGNAPGTGPEKARTWTVSAEIHPRRLPGLHLTLDYFDVDYRDRIQNISADYPIFLQNRAIYGSLIDDQPSAAAIAGWYANPDFVNPYGIAASDVTSLVDARTRNLARVHQNGIDFDLGYQTRLSGHPIDVGLAGSWLFHVNRQIAPNSPSVDIGNSFGAPVSVRLRGHLAATFGPLDAAAFVNLVGAYRNGSVVPAEPVSSFTTVDLNLSYKLPADHGPLSGFRLAVSATNLFDRSPPYARNRTLTSAIGYDPANASPVGRTVSFEVIKSW
jgi:outer membrane receptor protein involved in Fe transport